MMRQIHSLVTGPESSAAFTVPFNADDEYDQRLDRVAIPVDEWNILCGMEEAANDTERQSRKDP